VNKEQTRQELKQRIVELEKVALRCARAVEAAREGQNLLRTILDSIQAGVAIIDAEDHVIVGVNTLAAELIGAPREEIEGQVCHMFICPAEKGKCPITDLGQTIDRSERVLVRADGKSAPILKTVASVILGGRKHLIESFLDISKRKAAEEALLKAHSELESSVAERTVELADTAEKLKQELTERRRVENALHLARKNLAEKAAALQEANEELSQYVHLASHDLKSLLRGIGIHADLLREDLQGTLNENQTDRLESLDRTVQRGLELVDRLLEFAMVGRQSQPNQTINLGRFLRELIESLDLPEDVDAIMGDDWPTIDIDRALLGQVFKNLIQNAIRFNHAPRKRVEIGLMPTMDEHYEVFVRDNGIGVDSRYHEQIFGAFERLHTRDEYEGAGVGLAIVRKAVTRLHGEVRVESEPGKGSTFIVSLPTGRRPREDLGFS
jgi:PAS domain S-box-containing protein